MTTDHMTEAADPDRLQVLIVGGGLGGLTAGAALREFADVTILERSPGLNEIGAAVHIAPNAHHILRRLGADLMGTGAVNCRGFRQWNAKMDKVVSDFQVDALKETGIEWALCYRADLQVELFRVATTPDGPGKPCTVIFDEEAICCDPDAGRVTTAKNTYQADVVIAADGIRSILRTSVLGSAFHAASSGESAYRGLLTAEDINANESTRSLNLLSEPCTSIISAGDRRLILYPTRNSTILNFAAILPDTGLHELSEERWSAPGNVSALLESFALLPQRFRDLLSLTKQCGLWQLRDQEPLDTWVRGRTILIGDAAHAMLPHQGQGAAMAIEDGEALAWALREATRDTAPEALQRVFRVRYKRATFVQQISRASGTGALCKEQLRKLLGDEADATFDHSKWVPIIWDYCGAADFEVRKPEWVLPAA